MLHPELTAKDAVIFPFCLIVLWKQSVMQQKQLHLGGLFYFLTIFVNIKVHTVFAEMLSLKITLPLWKESKCIGNELRLGFEVG